MGRELEGSDGLVRHNTVFPLSWAANTTRRQRRGIENNGGSSAQYGRSCCVLDEFEAGVWVVEQENIFVVRLEAV